MLRIEQDTETLVIVCVVGQEGCVTALKLEDVLFWRHISHSSVDKTLGKIGSSAGSYQPLFAFLQKRVVLGSVATDDGLPVHHLDLLKQTSRRAEKLDRLSQLE